MRTVFALNPEALRRLVAKGVVADPLVQEAYQHRKLIIPAGLTNAFVIEELTGKPIAEKWRYSVGVITGAGDLSVTAIPERVAPICFEKGQLIDIPWNEYLPEMTAGDVIIKGCNAFDPNNRAGVLLGGVSGGTVGLIMGSVGAQGITVVVPATHDKLVPSVTEAVRWLGIGRIDLATGMKVGMGILENAHLVTEVKAIYNLFGVQAAVVAGGGYDGAEGAVVIAAEGEEKPITQLFELVNQIRHEKRISGISLEKK